MRRLYIISCFVLTCLLAACFPAQPAGKLSVITHPDGPLFVGDRVSFEVLAPAVLENRGEKIKVTFQGQDLGTAGFEPYGLGKRSQATLWWAWNTRDLKPGLYTLVFTHLPGGSSWTETYSLRPQDQVLQPEPGAHWATTTTDCCSLHYITGSAAGRDIRSLGQEADQESAAVSQQMGTSLNKPIDLTFLSRVIGQGGFTLDGIYVSYLDDNYIGNNLPIVLHHELVHFYDAALGGTYRPTFLAEGLAVYLSGGHFKPEPLAARAAALVNLGRYIPLKIMTDNFYDQQHEIAYLEAASLVGYMLDTYGWAAFNGFYRTIQAPNGRPDSAVIDAALREHVNLSFTGLESAYLASLRAQSFTDSQSTDLRLTVEFFDTARRYQAAFDPSAYYLTAWLPDGAAMRKQNIVADFLRRPDDWKNRLIEARLIQAHAELFNGDYAAAQRTLIGANSLINVLASLKYTGGDFLPPALGSLNIILR